MNQKSASFSVLAIVIVLSVALVLVGTRLYNISHEYEAQTKTLQAQTEKLQTQIEELLVRRDMMDSVEDALKNDYKYWLCLMDYDLKSVKNGKYAFGSFTDYFVPNAGKALKAGAPEKLVKDRIESVVTMATQGLFLSGYEEQLMEAGGSNAIRAYAYNWLELK